MPRVPVPHEMPRAALEPANQPPQINIGVASRIGEAGRAMGNAVASIGHAFGEVLGRIGEAQERVNYDNARLEWMKGDFAIQDELVSNAGEDGALWQTAPDRYAALNQEIDQKYPLSGEKRRQFEFWREQQTFKRGIDAARHYQTAQRNLFLQGFEADVAGLEERLTRGEIDPATFGEYYGALSSKLSAMDRTVLSQAEIEGRTRQLQGRLMGALDRHLAEKDPVERARFWDEVRSKGQFEVDALLPDGKEGPSGIRAAPPGTPGVIAAITHQPYRAFDKNGYGERLTGTITVNGRTYQFVTGGSGRGSIPLGEYQIRRYTSGGQRAREGFQYRKDAFELSDKADDAPGVAGDHRRGLLIHDGNSGVTAGCIGIKGDFEAFKRDLMAEAARNGGKFPKLQLAAPQQGSAAMGGADAGAASPARPLPDFRGQTAAAAIRFNNPGAMYPGPSSRKFGAVGVETIGGGHKIAVFPDAISGAAAQFDLLTRYAEGGGISVRDAITKWSGSHNVPTYLSVIKRETGLGPDDIITPEKLKDPAYAIALAKAMAVQEAGKGYPLSDDEWAAAHAKAFGYEVAPRAPGVASGLAGIDAPIDGAPRPANDNARGPGTPPFGRLAPGQTFTVRTGRGEFQIPSEWINALPDRQRQQVARQASEQQRLFERNRQAVAKSMMKDGEAHMMRHGTPHPGYDLETIKAAYAKAPETVREHARRMEIGRMSYDAVAGMRDMPSDEIAAKVTEIEFELGAEGVTDAATQKVIEIVKKRADGLLRLRETDPAGAVEDSREVRSVREKLVGGAPRNKLEWQALFEARLMAQARIEIPEERRSPITAREARALGQGLVGLSVGQAYESIAALHDRVAKMYGEKYSGLIVQRVVDAVIKDKTRRETVNAIVRDMDEQGAISPTTIERVKTLEELGRRERELKGEPPKPPPPQPSLMERLWRSLPELRWSAPKGSAAPTEQPTQPTPGAAAAPKTYPKPAAIALETLKREPHTAPLFDQKFGPGAAERAIPGIGKRLKTEAKLREMEAKLREMELRQLEAE